MAFLSPAFPVGGFSYSHGLERAAHDGLLPDADALQEWLADLVAFGSGWNDAVLFAEAHRRAGRRRSAANSPSLPRRLPARRNVTAKPCCRVRPSSPLPRWPHPVLRTPARRLPLLRSPSARSSARTRSPLETALAAWLQAFVDNLVQAGDPPRRHRPAGRDGRHRRARAAGPRNRRAAPKARRSTISARRPSCPTSSP